MSLGPKNWEITLLDLISPETFALESLPGSWEQLELESIRILFISIHYLVDAYCVSVCLTEEQRQGAQGSQE